LRSRLEMVLVQSLLIPFILLILYSCSQEESSIGSPQVIVATIDKTDVSETSFQRTYLPVLLYGDKFDSEETRDEVLNFLIGQKLLADVAREIELDTAENIQRNRTRVENKAMSRKLYQQWVRKEVSPPTEVELREGFKRGKKGLFVRHLFSESESEIREYYSRLVSNEENFYTLAQDVFSDTMLSRNGGALGWVTFGDLDETLEDTVYTLRPGRISQPVKSQYGWHILAIDDSQEEVFVTESDFEEHRDIIRNKIIERRENVLGKTVLNDFMDQFDIQFNREITSKVWPMVIKHLNLKEAEAPQIKEFSALVSTLDNLKDETLLTVDGDIWTVAEILKRLPEIDRTELYGNLYLATSNIVRDEMLNREARRLELHKHPDVIEEVKDSHDQMLADVYVSLFADTLKFDNTAQENYYRQHQLQQYHAPDSLRLELFFFKDSLSAVKAMYQLRNGMISTNPGDKKIWLDRDDDKKPIYKLSRSIALETMAGPLRFEGKWTLVKLIERRRSPYEFEDIKERVLADMEKERFNTTRNILLSEIRPQHEISIDYEMLYR